MNSNILFSWKTLAFLCHVLYILVALILEGKIHLHPDFPIIQIMKCTRTQLLHVSYELYSFEWQLPNLLATLQDQPSLFWRNRSLVTVIKTQMYVFLGPMHTSKPQVKHDWIRGSDSEFQHYKRNYFERVHAIFFSRFIVTF